MAECREFKKLAQEGIFTREAMGAGRWKISGGAEVVVTHNGKEIRINGFNDGDATQNRNCVRYLQGNNNAYIPMRYVWIDPDQLRKRIPYAERPAEKKF